MRRRLVCALAAFALAACSATDDPADAALDLPTIDPGALTACIAPGPGTAEVGPDDLQGHDVAVLEGIADELGLRLEVEVTTVDDVVAGVGLNSSRCDLAAAAVVDRPALGASVTTSSPYHQVHRLVVATTTGPVVEPEAVTGTVGVEDGGPATDAGDALLDADLVGYPSRVDLGRALTQGLVDLALVDLADRLALEEQLGIGLTVRAVVATDQRTVLLLPLDADEELAVAVDGAIATMAENGRLDDLADRWMHR